MSVDPLASPPLATPWVPLWPLAPTPVITPIHLSTPRISTLAGNAFWQVGGLTAWDAGHWEFTKDVAGKLYGVVGIPPSASPLAATIRLRLTGSAAGVTHMECSTATIAPGGSINPAGLTFISPSRDVNIPSAYAMIATTFALAVAPAAGSLLVVEINHDGTHANDTLAVNTWLLGAWLEMT